MCLIYKEGYILPQDVIKYAIIYFISKGGDSVRSRVDGNWMRIKYVHLHTREKGIQILVEPDFFKYRKNKTNFKVILKMYVISYIVLTCSIHYCSLADGTRYEAATSYETWIYTPWWYTLRGSCKLRDVDLHPVQRVTCSSVLTFEASRRFNGKDGYIAEQTPVYLHRFLIISNRCVRIIWL